MKVLKIMDLAICAFLKLTNVQQATKTMEDKQCYASY